MCQRVLKRPPTHLITVMASTTATLSRDWCAPRVCRNLQSVGGCQAPSHLPVPASSPHPPSPPPEVHAKVCQLWVCGGGSGWVQMKRVACGFPPLCHRGLTEHVEKLREA